LPPLFPCGSRAVESGRGAIACSVFLINPVAATTPALAAEASTTETCVLGRFTVRDSVRGAAPTFFRVAWRTRARADCLAAAEAQRESAEIRAEAVKSGSDCAYVDIAAAPLPLLRAEDARPGETVQRAGWQQIVERRDVLADAAAKAVLKWDGGKAWPVGHTAPFDPASSPAAAQWTAGLSPGPTGQPPTVLERLLLEHATSVDRVVELLYDEGIGVPSPAPSRPYRRSDLLHAGASTDQQRFPAGGGNAGRQHGLDPHRRRPPMARPGTAWARPVVGIQRKRPSRPFRTHQSHSSGRDDHLQARPVDRCPGGLAQRVPRSNPHDQLGSSVTGLAV